jgi:hypothetical protein
MKHVNNGCINVNGENICKSQTKYTSMFPRLLKSPSVWIGILTRQQTLQIKVRATLPRPSTRSSKETTRPTTKLLLAASWKLPRPRSYGDVYVWGQQLPVRFYRHEHQRPVLHRDDHGLGSQPVLWILGKYGGVIGR